MIFPRLTSRLEPLLGLFMNLEPLLRLSGEIVLKMFTLAQLWLYNWKISLKNTGGLFEQKMKGPNIAIGSEDFVSLDLIQEFIGNSTSQNIIKLTLKYKVWNKS